MPFGQWYLNGCRFFAASAITQYAGCTTRDMDGIEQRPVSRVMGGKTTREPDAVSVEAALSISVHAPDSEPHSLGLTMRTPGQDENLVLGLLLSEGIIDTMSDVERVEESSDAIEIHLSEGASFAPSEHIRRTTTTSSCGVCGRESISNLLHIHGPPLSEEIVVGQSEVTLAISGLRSNQKIFELTGGTHACARVSPSGGIIDISEDIGRHNAMDKLVGAAMGSDQLPICNEMVVVSGRASFELVQKALRAGFPIFIAVGAPSTLAVDLANEHGMTLIGFARDDRMTVFSGNRRVANGSSG